MGGWSVVGITGIEDLNLSCDWEYLRSLGRLIGRYDWNVIRERVLEYLYYIVAYRQKIGWNVRNVSSESKVVNTITGSR